MGARTLSDDLDALRDVFPALADLELRDIFAAMVAAGTEGENSYVKAAKAWLLADELLRMREWGSDKLLKASFNT